MFLSTCICIHCLVLYYFLLQADSELMPPPPKPSSAAESSNKENTAPTAASNKPTTPTTTPTTTAPQQQQQAPPASNQSSQQSSTPSPVVSTLPVAKPSATAAANVSMKGSKSMADFSTNSSTSSYAYKEGLLLSVYYWLPDDSFHSESKGWAKDNDHLM